MSNNKNLVEDGKATRFPHNDPTKGGRKPSIKRQLKELMSQDGETKIPKDQVVSINDDGSVTLKLPTQMQMAMKLCSWAMSKKGNDSLKAIQMIIDQIDGKSPETVSQTNNYLVVYADDSIAT